MSKATSDLLSDDLTAASFEPTGPISATLKSNRGIAMSTTDLLGAIVGSIVLLGGAIFGIAHMINYTHDSNAQSALEQVKTAQVLYQSSTGSFAADAADLTKGTTPALVNKPASLKMTANATDYCAVVKSDSMDGNRYWITARSGKVLTAKPDAAAAGITCPDPS